MKKLSLALFLIPFYAISAENENTSIDMYSSVMNAAIYKQAQIDAYMCYQTDRIVPYICS